jgi:hypothetical protein
VSGGKSLKMPPSSGWSTSRRLGYYILFTDTDRR